MPNALHASEVNYNILTGGQFVNDYPDAATAQIADSDKVLVLTDDEDQPLFVIVGDNAPMLAELTADIAEYAAQVADPGAVLAKVGPSSTVVAE